MLLLAFNPIRGFIDGCDEILEVQSLLIVFKIISGGKQMIKCLRGLTLSLFLASQILPASDVLAQEEQSAASGSTTEEVVASKDENQLPDYYQDVIDFYQEKASIILSGDVISDDSLLDRYTHNMEINNIHPALDPNSKLIYALKDLDNNGVPELFLAVDSEEYDHLFHIYTFDGEKVRTIAGYGFPDDEGKAGADGERIAYITNRSHVQIYRDGRVLNELSGGAQLHSYTLFQLNSDTGDFDTLGSYKIEGGNGVEVVTDLATGKVVEEGNYAELLDYDPDNIVDIFAEWTWVSIGESAVDPSDQDTESSVSSAAEEENQSDYLQALRELNKKWQTRCQDFVNGQRASMDDLMQLDLTAFQDHDVYHPIVAAMYQKAQEVMGRYDRSVGATYRITDIDEVQDIIQHTFAIEKMLLPELSSEALQALNDLRFYCLSAYYQAVDESYQESQFMSYGSMLSSMDKIEDYVADILTTDDGRYDLLNRVTIATGKAAEFNGFSFDEAKWEYFNNPYPDGSHHLIMMRTGAGAQDISGNQIFYIDKQTGLLESSRLGTNSIEPIEVFDYSAYYGVSVKNHYPSYQGQELADLPTPSFDRDAQQQLSVIMYHWQNSMGQVYQEYQLDNPVDFYGAKLPTQTFEINLDGQVVSVNYQEDGEGIRVDAVYSDIEDQDNPLPERHIYLFIADPNRPRVLVSMAGPDEAGRLTFKDTQNAELTRQFYDFVAREFN